MSSLAVQARGLSVKFGDVTAVAGLDLDVKEGEIVGLVGPDGAGKTTTMRVLCGILVPDAGEAVVAGHDVLREPDRVKARIGYLPQRFALHPDLTVNENIAYLADLYSVPAGTWQQRRDELLEITDLARFANRQAVQLSGGMQQKLALICTLIHRPEVVFLDEPTTGVDPVSRRDFWHILYDLPRQGVTVVVTTPYMDEAAHCSRIAFMHQGRVLAQDSPAALRAAITARILEVRCRPQRTAREALKRYPTIEGVEVFGDRLRVAVSAEADPAAIRRVLEEAGVTGLDIRESAASLEDVFVALAVGQQSQEDDSRAGEE